MKKNNWAKKVHSEKGEVEWALFIVAMLFAGLLSVAFMVAGYMKSEQLARRERQKLNYLYEQDKGRHEDPYMGPHGHEVTCKRSKLFSNSCI